MSLYPCSSGARIAQLLCANLTFPFRTNLSLVLYLSSPRPPAELPLCFIFYISKESSCVLIIIIIIIFVVSECLCGSKNKKKILSILKINTNTVKAILSYVFYYVLMFESIGMFIFVRQSWIIALVCRRVWCGKKYKGKNIRGEKQLAILF